MAAYIDVDVEREYLVASLYNQHGIGPDLNFFFLSNVSLTFKTSVDN